MRFLVLTAGATLAAFLALLIDAQSRTPPNRPVDRSRPATIFAPGRVEGITPEIELRPQVSGRIVRVLVEEGQWVEPGQVLVQLDDDQHRQEVALAAARLELAQAQLERLVNGAHRQARAEAAAMYRAKQAELERAELSWKRILKLREARAVAQQEADNQRTRVASLQGEVEAAKARLDLLQAEARPDEVRIDRARVQVAKAQLKLAEVQLQRTQLRAPGRGQVLKVYVEPGELTGPTSAEPAVVMADTGRFQVRAFVEELDAPRVQVGMTARVVADGMPGRELRGRVIRLSPRMSPKRLFSDDPTERHDTKTREVWIELEDAGELVVGLRVDAMIDPHSPDPAGGKPASAAR